MSDIYGMAWKVLEKRIARSRRRSITKAELAQWRLEALEGAIDAWSLPSIILTGVSEDVEQEKA